MDDRVSKLLPEVIGTLDYGRSRSSDSMLNDFVNL